MGFGGLGENGLACDTVSPQIIPGSIRKGQHNLPRILASDGSAVFTAKGWPLGLVKGNRIVRIDR